MVRPLPSAPLPRPGCNDIEACDRQRRAALCKVAAALAVVPLALAAHGQPAAPATSSAARAAWPESAAASVDTQRLVRWALASQDMARRPFAVVDKPAARIHVFAASGDWLGSAPVLLGSAYGDTSVPGIGERPLAAIRPEERTTPAGRFASEPGRNTRGDDLVWIDYDTAVSLHRVRSVHLGERRHQRLASDRPADRRISNGCVNVAHAFYDRAIAPTLGRMPGVVYVLPDSAPFASLFIAASAY